MVIHIPPEALHTRGGLLDELMDKCFDAAMLVSPDLHIIHISKSGARFSGSTQKELDGSPLDDEPRRARFRQVIGSGVSLPSQLIEIFGRVCILTVLPIIWEGQVLGALGMIIHKNLEDIKRILAIMQSSHTQTSAVTYDTISRLASAPSVYDYIGQSPAIKEMLRECATIAKSSYPVLILGETGTGKELVAGILHSLGTQVPFAPFISINCTAIPEPLLESELFGHVKGAFTGATSSKQGKFELAAGGSLLLDEIGDMAIGLQSKLLRVLESKEFERVGETALIPLQARIISSTNCDILEKCKEGRFRSDLYYRLSTFEVHVPPLRERAEDIPLLVQHFIQQEHLSVAFDRSAIDVMMDYTWPGNVRQLRNIVLRLGVRKQNQIVSAADIHSAIVPSHSTCPPVAAAPAPVAELRQTIEQDSLVRALEQSGYNFTKAADLLGISRTTVYKRARKYGFR